MMTIASGVTLQVNDGDEISEPDSLTAAQTT
jgi:hypothetical protein